MVAHSLTPNTRYTLRAWTRVTNSESARLTVTDFGSPDASAFLTGYAEQRVSFTTGPTATSASLFFWKDAGAGYAFGDDFTLTKDGPR